MAVSNTKTIGLAEQYIQYLQDNKTLFQDKGYDTTNQISTTGHLKSDAVTQVGKQDELEAASKAQTKVANTSVKTLYESVSSGIDAAMGVLGKKSPAAKQLGKLRSSLIKQYKKNKDEPKKS